MTISLNTNLPAVNELPDTYIISLSEFGAITLAGEEQSKYLQGQVTCDVNESTSSSLLTGAHCNAKGKVFSTFRLINRLSEHMLLQPKSSIKASLAELQKFGVFAKVSIKTAENINFYALVGEEAENVLQSKYQQVPDSLTPVINIGTTSLVYISGQQNRYLIIDEAVGLLQRIQQFELPIYSYPIWELLEISEGFPLLSENSVNEYVPQMLNLQAINGISFTKGCYLGQETVARMQYLGKNKRALFTLIGNSKEDIKTTDIIEKQLGENWRKAGDVIMSYQADNGKVYIQGVLANDVETSTNFRIKGDEESSFNLSNLPYTIT